MSEHLTWVEIDLKAVKRNYQTLFKIAHEQFKGQSSHVKNPPQIMAVVKADAYGHGMLKVAEVLDKLNIFYFGVSNVNEGRLLREHGIERPILLFETTLPFQVREVVELRLTPTVCTLEFARALNVYARSLKRQIDIHVKVDTGMGRLGVWHTEAPRFIEDVLKLSHLSIKGLYTHFPIADTDPAFTKSQVEQLNQLVKQLDQKAQVVPYIHAANSIGLVGYKTDILNLARPGLMLYGLYPTEAYQSKIALSPVMTVKSRVMMIKKIDKGSGISYGHTFVAKKPLTIAVLPIGYSDGYLRGLSNKAAVLVNGKKCPIIGRVTMDQIIIDVTAVKNVRLGQEVTVLGREGKQSVTAEDLGRVANTINYEIVCSLGSRCPRIYKA